jgi:8-oxo-dGTP diphosphatase
MYEDVEFRFCPVCGGSLLQKIIKEREPQRLVCSQCEFVFYLDPKVVACSIDPQRGKWVLPGGYVDRGEEVTAAAIRETEEECGLTTRIVGLLGVYSYPGRPAVVVVYVTEYVSGELIAGDETEEVALYGQEEIPWMQLAFQSTVDALKDYQKQRR